MEQQDDEDSYYETALAALHSSLHQSKTKQAIAKAAARRTKTVSDMRIYMERCGIEVSKSTNENDDDSEHCCKRIIHVTGTKGKGSVCAMCESILRTAYGQTTGLFTSPHLTDIRERIRINGLPVSRRVFGQAYWTIRRRLEEYNNTDDENHVDDENDGLLPVLPGYFRMLTLMAFYIFQHYDDNGNKVSCIILEVGMGGRYDATNSYYLPPSTKNVLVVCGVTLIDYDHTRVLGNTLEEIAWEKGGIFQVRKGCSNESNITPHPKNNEKEYRAAVAKIDDHVQQSSKNDDDGARYYYFALDTNTESVIQMLRQCAATEGEGGVLTLVGSSSSNNNPKLLPDDCPIGLPGSHQRVNAELAVALCNAVMQRRKQKRQQVTTMEAVCSALENVSWPGRCQTVECKKLSAVPTTLRLDGAHTVQSVQAGLEWFQSVASSTNAYRILIFNCSHERNPVELLDLLLASSVSFRAVYFCRADSERPSAISKPTAAQLLKAAGKQVNGDLLFESSSARDEKPSWQDTLAGVWKHLEREARDKSSGDVVRTNLTASSALESGLRLAEEAGASGIEVFVTGSLYLVGSMLAAIEWSEPEAKGGLRLQVKAVK